MTYDVKSEGRGKKLPCVLNQKEFEAILKVTPEKNYRLAFKLGFLCGLRVSEVTKLQPGDVDLGRGMLFIREAKGKKDRYVPIAPPIIKDLKNLPIKCGIRALQIAFGKKVKLAGVNKPAHFHTLRHSAATFYLANGMNIRQVQQLLGHSRIDTTTIYLHVSPDDVKNKMEEIWG